MAKAWRCSYQSFYSDGTEVVNVFHVVDNPNLGFNDATADEVRDAVDGALTTAYKGLIPTTASVATLTVREEVSPTSGDIPEQSVKTIGAAGTYSPANTNLPKAVTVLAAVKTNAAIRSGHGRFWLPPALDSGLVTGGLWATSSTFWTRCTTFMAAYVGLNVSYGSGGLDGNITPVIYSRTRRARGDSSYWFGVSAYALETKPHWLRSRQTSP